MNETETPPPDQSMAFDEIERQADLARSYAKAAREAAHRGDRVTVLVHLKQLRLCVIAAIKTYQDFLDGQPGL